ncbi:DUF1656 domain-containing protein [Rhodospirillum rubrum]|uniref:Conserved hypothetical membrane protein n=1 Tax=Rhodospirillum rubrum (strain ATCC 11170 / ATH 1.1.1 / DSM 467 / LMG 4362 / NCIMB 8255 / S1) TaxID=269796 RepID=Q2RSZ2_RHORT|nr:DUF1656 domain-containing protein [Rhodospirillum rubrum]ABC22753.1 conserved hypothetical membrane protein [Rhodospirillum rubrum ATCC 11170]AEO48474.1 hypothetical protein F11_10040 [Rhodospirillum rubrum F11]MBK5954350.1 DUF1656 domain-containing protein [Rhodospirillum rubrum]QXG78745.1 DUF1656 domain-containing protein [Rhodospirillum rubrum]HAQ00863.1 DUF1656 domain-containing protein [Rhodospirillum rubrum]
MIVDLTLGGVLVPGLLGLALIALVATIAVIRLLSVAGLTRLFVSRPLVEIATFALIYALLVRQLSSIGL